MNKMFKENGDLTADAKRMLMDFNYGLSQVMASDGAHDMTESELLLLGTHLHKLIGDTITNRIVNKRQFQKMLDALTDEQFDTYLKDKYGETWFIHSLEEEELKRVPLPDLQKLADEMASVAQNVAMYMDSNGVRLK